MKIWKFFGLPITELAAAFGEQASIPPHYSPDDSEFMIGRYVRFHTPGVEVYLDDADVITTIFLFSGNSAHPEHARYEGELIAGLTFESSRNAVHAVLGTPYKSNDVINMVGPVAIYPWDLFSWAGLMVNFTYTENLKAVQLFTVTGLTSEQKSGEK